MIDRHYGNNIYLRLTNFEIDILIYLGHIVAIGSNCGLFGLSHLGDYCASKFAAIGMNRESCYDIDNLFVFSLMLGYMECVEDEIFRSKCSGVNTTSN